MAGRVNALAEDPHLGPLWKAVHDRLCRGGAGDRSVITVRGADPDTRLAVDRLLGRVSSAGQLRVHLGVLDAALHRAGTTAAVVAEAAVGPVVDRAAHRAATAVSTDAAWEEIRAHPAAGEPALADWLERLRAQGRLARVGGAGAVRRALDVLGVLPWDGPPLGRPVLAATILGGEHDLDDNTTVGRLVLAALAARGGITSPLDATGRAGLWAAAGVSLDAVSTPVLALGLRPYLAGPLTEGAARWADGGVPLPIPTGALTAETWRVEPGQLVSVCENPSVIEAAATALGPTSRPLVCISGMPGRAATMLLTSLAAGGAQLRYHGDFGTGGITIANLVIARHGADPWRMCTHDHRHAVERLTSHGRVPTPLRGRVPPASWDPHLAAAIVAYGLEVTEEHVLDGLLGDLAAD